MIVAVVGGGISGLTAAYRLQQKGIDYRLIESMPRAGGVVQTDHDRGFTIEGGPDSFLAEKPWARELCGELGLGDELIATNTEARKIYIVSRGKLRPLPAGIVRLIPTDPVALIRSRLLSVRGSVRAALEPLVPSRSRSGDEAIGAWARRRFGDELHERLIDPLLSGIYAGDADQLSIESTFPHLRDLEQKGSVLRALRAAKPSTSRPAFLSLRNGMQQLVDALMQRLDPARVIRGSHVGSLRSLNADVVILAVPAWAAADLVSDVDSGLAALLRRIPHVSTATISLAYKSSDIPRPLDGFGFVVPRVERRKITACTWVTTKLAHRAPEGTVLLRCFVGRAGEEEWTERSDEDLVNILCDELRALMGINAAPEFTRVYRWLRRMPQYLVGHQELLAEIDAATARHRGLYLTGCSYRGVGLPDCIREATATVERVLSNR